MRFLIKRKKFIISIFLPLFIGAACTLPGFSPKKGDGGVWASDDRGATWEQKVFISEEDGKVKDISNLDVYFIEFHTMDTNILYASTNRGLFFTDNRGEKWTKIFDKKVSSMSVVHSNKSSLYVASGNSVYYTEDNGGNWKQVYFDSRKVSINQILVDYKDESKIYIGTSAGELIRSDDKALSWNLVKQFRRTSVSKVLMNIKDTDQIYVGTSTDGIWVSYDGGENWNNLKDRYKDYRGSDKLIDIVMDGRENIIYFASSYGLLKSVDGGNSWTPVDLLTPSKSTNITALAVNSINGDEVFYTSPTVIYRSYDGGKNWITSKINSKRAISDIIVDFYNPNKIYIGVKEIKKKQGFFL